MTTEEFRDWLRAYCRLFPDAAAWLREQREETRAALRAAWAPVYETIDARDASAATAAIMAGTAAPIPKWDMPMLVAKLKAITSEIATARIERIRKQHQDEERQRFRDSRRGVGLAAGMMARLDAYGCGAALREINRRVDGGEDRETVKADVLARLRREWNMVPAAGGEWVR